MQILFTVLFRTVTSSFILFFFCITQTQKKSFELILKYLAMQQKFLYTALYIEKNPYRPHFFLSSFIYVNVNVEGIFAL